MIIISSSLPPFPSQINLEIAHIIMFVLRKKKKKKKEKTQREEVASKKSWIEERDAVRESFHCFDLVRMPVIDDELLTELVVVSMAGVTPSCRWRLSNSLRNA